jgi:hypothetical protein
LEFGEIRRVAQRTIDQRHIFVNNLAIRRATEELKVAESFQQASRILRAAFTATLAEALHRTAVTNIEFIPAPQNPALVSAQAG